MPLNLAEAKKAGYSDEEIQSYLLSSPKAKEARKAGYSDNDILAHYGVKETPSGGPIGGLIKGGLAGVTDVLGAPADLANLPIQGVAKSVAGAGEAIGDIFHYITSPPEEKKRLNAIPFDKYKKNLDTKAEEVTKNIRVPVGAQDIRQTIQSGTEQLGLPKDTFVYKNYSELPESERPFAVAGEAFLSALAPGRIISKLAKAPEAIARSPAFLRGPIKLAKESPAAFRAMERTAAGGAAAGGAVTASQTDNPTKIAAGEIVGSLLSPTSLAMRAAGASGKETSGLLGGVKNLFTGANDYKAAEYIQKTLTEHGEDPAKLAGILRDAKASGLKLTAGQTTQSPVLLELENQFARKNSKFGSTVAKNTKESLELLRDSASQLEATGNPEALRAAAKLRQTYFDRLLGDQVSAAKEGVLKAAAKLSPEGRAVAGDVSADAHDILAQSLAKARTTESKLWGNIPKNAPAALENTMQKALAAKNTYLTDVSEVPSGLSDFFKRAETNDGRVTWTWKNPKVTSGELTKLRSKALELSRQAQGASDWRNAAVYREIADGALADLEKIPSIKEPLQNARDYSRSLHDSFTRTFAGDALSRDPTGAYRIEPETLLRRSLGGGNEGANMRFDQMLAAAKFGNTRLADAMRGVQERYLRLNARKLVDPETGKVSQTSLSNFVRDNEGLLEQFPALRADFKSLSAAQKAVDDSISLQDKATKAMAQKALFGQLIDNEDPAFVVGKALRQNPVSNYAQLSRFAKASGPEAVGGLRTSTIQHAFNEAFDNSGELSWTRFKQNLTAPIGKGRVSTLDLMRSNGVISKAEEDRLLEIVVRGEQIESSARSGALDVHPPQEDMLSDLLIATGASKLGKMATKPLGGTTLVAQSAFTRAGRKLFEKLPNARVMDFIMDATQNPETMAMLLEKPTNAKKAANLMERLQVAMERGGYIPRGPLFAAGEAIGTEQKQ